MAAKERVVNDSISETIMSVPSLPEIFFVVMSFCEVPPSFLLSL